MAKLKPEDILRNLEVAVKSSWEEIGRFVADKD